MLPHGPRLTWPGPEVAARWEEGQGLGDEGEQCAAAIGNGVDRARGDVCRSRDVATGGGGDADVFEEIVGGIENAAAALNTCGSVGHLTRLGGEPDEA